jgi:outer membrane PBP1 activator LpoA protein
MHTNSLTNRCWPHRTIVVFSLSSLLFACATAQPPATSPTTTAQTSAPSITLISEVKERGGATENETLDPVIIDWIATVASDYGWLFAQGELDVLDNETVNNSTRDYAASQLAWLSGDLETSAELLNRLQATDPQSVALIVREKQRRLTQSGDYLGAARLAVNRANTGSPALASSGTEIFELLSNASRSQLEAAIRRADPESVWHGWLTLNHAYREGKPAVRSWLTNHRNHPANQVALPAGLSRWLNDRPPVRIAVLLPLSGRLKSASEETLNGIVQGIYSHYRADALRPDLITIDTELLANGGDAYQLAIESGADFVIGPLVKSRVAEVAALPALPVPVLALNRVEPAQTGESNANLLSLSLAPEDEAAQISEIAWGKGLRSPLIIAETGLWGARMTDALSTNWERLGGSNLQSTVLNPEVEDNQTVANKTGTGSSINRIRAIERAFDAPVDTQPRKRDDIDSIFILVDSTEKARELRPLLKFNYAGDLPVFAPSSIYQVQTGVNNRDLDGVNFVVAPGLMGTVGDQRQLFLLGLDAAQFVSHFNQALTTSATVMHGETGRLAHDLRGNVLRRLNPVVFARGRVQAGR